jgi:flavin-dependent dehydrogenase
MQRLGSARVHADERKPQDRYDVAILGGGLAGLTLALQLKRARPETSVFVAEKRKGPAPEASFKVGESTLEIGAHYFGRVLGLEDHIEAEQLPKMGVRFFFPAGDKSDIAQRAEYGPPFRPALPTYQLDRGRFENELADRVRDAGADLFGGCKVEDVDLDSDDHTVTVTSEDGGFSVKARWVIGATGRASFMRRKLGLDKEVPHAINSAWFRLEGELDPEDWSTDEKWLDRMSERGLRRLSTNHLIDKGYWVWLIPLSSGSTSVGIVADPRIHPFEEFNTLEAALDWITRNEPQLAQALEGRQDQIVDFLKVEHYSHGCKRVFSPERWCVTGDAGAFIDPLFSPGSDFIGTSNSFITDLVLADLGGDDITARAEFANSFYLRYFDAWLTHHKDFYPTLDNALATILMFGWYRMTFFGVSVLLFYENKLTNPDFLRQVEDEMERFTRLIPRVQQLVRDWHELEQVRLPGELVKPVEFTYIGEAMGDLKTSHDQEGPAFDEATLREKVAERMRVLEAAAVVFFYEAAKNLPDNTVDRDTRVDPYAISLDPGRWDSDGVFSEDGITVAEALETAAGISERVEELRSLAL